MNICSEWEDLLLQYEELGPAERSRAGRHLALCPRCRAFLETLQDLDLDLTAALAEVEPTPAFRTRVLAHRPHAAVPLAPWLPEALDGIGWFSLLALAAVLGWHFSPTWFQTSHLLHAGLLLSLAALVFGIRSAAGTHP